MAMSRPRRLLRTSKACDYCHKRRIKCQPNPLDPVRCQNCVDFDITCTYHRPSVRGVGSPRVIQPNTHTGLTNDTGVSPQANTHLNTVATDVVNGEHSLSYGPEEAGDNGSSTADNVYGESLSSAWQGFAHSCTPTIKKLLAVYQDVVQPIFPFFDQARLERRLELFDHVRNRAFFCSVMAACALAAARARDGALGPYQAEAQGSLQLPPETFYAAAEEALPRDLLQCQNFDYLRGCALLALASIQDAKIGAMQKYVGQYFTILAINQWHDESNWPQGLRPVELDERRRLYWSIYTLDVYSSIVWDGCIHFQEGHTKVQYPGSSGDQQDTGTLRESHWMVGWNFTTDLYRILEHDVSRLRSRPSKFEVTQSTGTPTLSSLALVADLYSSLPPAFKQLKPVTGDPRKDIYGFQAANIQATMALQKMVCLTLEVDTDQEKKCSVVSDVLSTFHQVPKPYLRAISTPLIYHIGVIGVILGSVMEGPLSESSCRRVRDLLLSMAALLENLEAFLHRGAGAGRRLRNLVARIEEYMESRINRQSQPQSAMETPPGMFQQTPSTAANAWDGAALQDLSPQFQLPDELLQDWMWPFPMSNNYSSF